MACNRWLYLTTVVIAILLLLTTAVIHLMNWWNILVEKGVFDQNADKVWTNFASYMVYSKWMLYTWVAVYGLQLFWLLYGIELVFRKAKAGNLFSQISVLPPSVFIFFMVGLAATISCHLLWTSSDNQYRYAPILMLLTCLCTYIALFIAGANVGRYDKRLRQADQDLGFIWENRWLVHNAIGAYASLATIVLFYQVAVQIDDIHTLGDDGPVYLFLGLLQFHILAWLLVDLFLSRNLFPYLFTPFVLCILAFLQVVLKHEAEGSNFVIVAGIFLGFTAFLTLVKVWQSVGISTMVREKFTNLPKPDPSI